MLSWGAHSFLGREDGASLRASQHLRLNFTKTYREDSASNWPLCHWLTLSGQLHYFSGTMMYSVRLGRIVRNHPVLAFPSGQNGTQPLQTAGRFSTNLHMLLLHLTFLFPNHVPLQSKPSLCLPEDTLEHMVSHSASHRFTKLCKLRITQSGWGCLGLRSN